LDHESLRAKVVSYFQTGNSWSLNALFQKLTDGDPPDLCYTEEHRRGYLRDGISSRINAIVHEMLRCGILAPAVAWHGGRRSIVIVAHDLPLQVTEYGRQVLGGDESAVPDPDSYMAGLRRDVPRLLTRLERSYLEESVRAFHLYLYRASLVMLGGASEVLMARVIKGTSGKLPNGSKIDSELDKSILAGFRAWRASLEQNKQRLPPRSGEILQSVDHVFEIIRLCRNEAAHPKAVDVDRLEVQTLLLAFRRYARALLQLKRSMR